MAELRIADLAEARGVDLNPHGIDLVARCPFYDDRRLFGGGGAGQDPLAPPERFLIGCANWTLGYRPPMKSREVGAAIRGTLIKAGVLCQSGYGYFGGWPHESSWATPHAIREVHRERSGP